MKRAAPHDLALERCAEGKRRKPLEQHTQQSQCKQLTVTVQPLGGDSFAVVLSPLAKVRDLKAGIARIVGLGAHRQELYEVVLPEEGKSAVREDDAESRLLELGEEVVTGMVVALLVKDAVAWDEDWKGSCIELSEEGTVACCTTERTAKRGNTVRSKEFLEPKSGIHCFEYIYIQPGKGVDGKSMDGCYLVGVTKKSTAKASYSPDSEDYLSDGWWGLTDAGGVCKGDDELAEFAPEASMSEHGVAYGSGDRIGFSIDMDQGMMLFYRNGELIKGAEVVGVPTTEALRLVGCPDSRGSSVRLSVPVGFGSVERKQEDPEAEAAAAQPPASD
jgi:hypothetical protein